MDTRPPKPDDWQWLSICSKHQYYDENCGPCNTGRWISQKQEELGHWLYDKDYNLWLEWVNRAKSEERKFLEETFPGLAGKKR